MSINYGNHTPIITRYAIKQYQNIKQLIKMFTYLIMTKESLVGIDIRVVGQGGDQSP